VGDGLYIGRIWYTYPINGLAAGDFTCTVIGDSYIIKDGKFTASLQPNTVRINDNILRILNQIIGVGQERVGTFGWGADEIIYTPEIALEGVRITEIAEFGDQG
jgi:PmbA protein